MHSQSAHGLKRLANATWYSLKGIQAAWRSEAAFRQEVILAVVLLPSAVWLGTTMVQRAILILSVMSVLVVELLNSAIEATVDRIGPERHLLSGQAKNMGSAAVLLSLICMVVVWILVAWQRWG